MRHFIISLLLLCTILCGGAVADQQAWIKKTDADRAVKLISEGEEVRLFCEPCNDTGYTRETAVSVNVAQTGTEDYYEVQVNGAGIDLAYTYIEEDGQWVNLAKHLGLDAEGVSAVLPDTAEEVAAAEGEMSNEGDGGEGFTCLHYLCGAIGTKAVFMSLGLEDATLSGTYTYAHVGEPIFVTGNLEKDGSLTLTEFADDTRTGLFVGKLDADKGTVTGKWLTPAGDKQYEFTARRIAYLIEETRTVRAESQSFEVSLHYPYFVSDTASEATMLNTVVDKVVNDYLGDFAGELAEGAAWLSAKSKEDAEYEMPPFNYELSFSDFHHFSPALVSMAFAAYQYTGGAHGNVWMVPVNLRIKDGKPEDITLASLFKADSDYLTRLSAYCIEDLKKQGAALVTDGSITSFDANNLSSFVFSKRGITVFFAPYAVASYAEGPFEVVLPWDVLAEVVAPDIAAEVLPAK